MKKIDIKYLLIIILVPCLYLSFKIHKSYILQASILTEINSNQYTENTYNRLKTTNTNFPSVSVTTLPMSGVLARYHYAFGNIKESLDVINNQTIFKDYIYFNENLKAIIYNELNVRDSSYYYAKMAHINLPGNANHYEQYVKNLVALKDPSELIKSFDPLKFKKDFQFSKVFLAACLALKVDKTQILKQLDFIQANYNDNSEIRLMTEYLMYGMENVQKSIQLSQLADQNFDSDKINQALDLYIQASKLNPSAYTNFENIGFCYFKLAKYQEALPYFLRVVEELNPKTGKSEYLLGNTYFQLGNKKKACTYLYRSTKLNFKASFSDYSRICK